jgi:hypothetical protein
VTWRRVGFQRALFQPGSPGNLPWNQSARGDDGLGMAATPDGRLFAVGIKYGPNGYYRFDVWCSLDGGVHWTERCTR